MALDLNCVGTEVIGDELLMALHEFREEIARRLSAHGISPDEAALGTITDVSSFLARTVFPTDDQPADSPPEPWEHENEL